MTYEMPAGPHASFGHRAPSVLTSLVFRALFTNYDLHNVGGVHIVVPTGTPFYAGPSLGDIARRISQHAQADRDSQRLTQTPQMDQYRRIASRPAPYLG